MRRFAVVLLLCAVALPVSAASAWVWPVDGPVLRPFSFDRAHPYAGGQHRGIDIGAPTGAAVVAPARGVVSFAGTVPTGGKTVSIQTPLGYTATLVHLGSIGVREGAAVAEGDRVGTVGPSGTPELADPYLYFGVRLTADQQGYVDPLDLLPLQAATPAPPPGAEPVPASVVTSVGAASPAAVELPVSTPAPAVAQPATQATQPAAPPVAQPGEGQVVERAAPVVEPVRATKVAPDSVAPAVRQLRSATSRPRVPLAGREVTRWQARPSAVSRPQVSNVASPELLADVWGRGAEVAAVQRTAARGHNVTWLGVVLVVVTCAALGCAQAARRNRARIMSAVEPEPFLVEADATAQDPGRPRLAVCVGEAASGSRGRVRSSGRHLRALPPLEGRRRSDGEWHRRARNAGDGHGRSRGRLAA